MENTDLINRLDKMSNELNGMSDELYEKRNSHDHIDVDEAIDIVSAYLYNFWAEVDAIIEDLKGDEQ